MALAMDLSLLDKGGLQGALDNGMQQNQVPTQLVVMPGTQLRTAQPEPPSPTGPGTGTLGVKNSSEGTLTKFGQKE